MSKRTAERISTFGDIFITIVEMIIIAFVIALIIVTIYYTAQDFTIVASAGTTEELQFLVNDIFMIIVLVELLRSLLAAYKKKELHLVAVAEVGFIVIIREIVIAALSGSINDIAILSIAALIVVIILWLLLKKVLA